MGGGGARGAQSLQTWQRQAKRIEDAAVGQTQSDEKEEIKTHSPPQAPPFLILHKILASSHAYWEAWCLTFI